MPSRSANWRWPSGPRPWQRIGIPLRFILRKVLGFTDAEVEQVMKERLAQLKELAEAGSRQPGGPPPPQLAGQAAKMVEASDSGQRQGEREGDQMTEPTRERPYWWTGLPVIMGRR